jgi:Ni/Fe-hydrogenase subunit HybB-like protein
MASTPRTQQLPHGVGQITGGWLVLVAVALVITLIGVVAYIVESQQGMIATGMRNVGTMGGATWGLYISFVVYFVGVSFAGITIAALIRVLNWEYLKPLARIAELVTIIALVLAAIAIIADLGQPLRGLINLPRYARPQSPFFGTFTLVISGYLFASLVYFYLDSRKDAAACARVPGRLQRFHRWWAAGYQDTPEERQRRYRASFWLAIAIVPLLITAHSTLGFVFGLQVGRPGWFSAIQAPGFVILAGVSGIGILAVIIAIIRRTFGRTDNLNLDVFKFLGKALMALTLIYLYLMVVEVITAIYAAEHHEQVIFEAMLWGDFAWHYWLTVGSLALAAALLIWQASTGRWSIGFIVASGLLVQIGAVLKRYLLVVPSQTHGGLLPYPQGSYSPSLVEYGLIVGLIGLGILAFLIFMKVFPIMEVEDAALEGDRT